MRLFSSQYFKSAISIENCGLAHLINSIPGCVILSYRITFVIAFLLLLTGAALNDERGEEKMNLGLYCYVVKPGVFAGGAALSLASVSLGIIYYIIVASAKHTDPAGGARQNQGIALAQPQFPPQDTQPPVFVHEDTYNRQQFP